MNASLTDSSPVVPDGSGPVGSAGADDSPPADDHRIARRRSALRAELTKLAGQVKPKLRGWFHAGAFPLAMLGGLALVIISPTIESRIAAAVF
ncbi:MAG: PAQR family membrane homeostasis protein TrhA, partial [Brevibacterium linens]